MNQVLPQTMVSIRIFLEGPYEGPGMTTHLSAGGQIPLAQPYSGPPWFYFGDEQVTVQPMPDVVDWVLVELRETSGTFSPAAFDSYISRRSGLLMPDGYIRETDGVSLLQFDTTTTHDMYAVVWHRNHLGIISAQPLVLQRGSYSYDFTTDPDAAYRGLLAQKSLEPGIYGMAGGDGDANGQINNDDKITVWKNQAGSYGYLAGDFNLNGHVSNPDKVDIWQVNGGRGCMVPALYSCGEPIIDARDQQVYPTILIGHQCWMARNLNVGTRIDGIIDQADNGIIEKYCYNNSEDSCSGYGGLYMWNEMMNYSSDTLLSGICPDGWISPTDCTWKILEGNTDSQYGAGDPEWNGTGWRGFDAGKNLKSSHSWSNNGNGVDLFDFQTLPAGYRSSTGNFYNFGMFAYFWTSTESQGVYGWNRWMGYNSDEIARHSNDKHNGRSVRCYRSISNIPPHTPSYPQPPDSALFQSVSTVLSWMCTDPENDPVRFNIYFDTASPPSPVAYGHTLLSYDPGNLEINKIYYWKIDACDPYGHWVQGPLWHFSTYPNQPPVVPYDPVPPDGATGIGIQCMLIWNCYDPENDPLYYDIYFGTDIPLPLVSGWQSTQSFDPGALYFNTQYYWKVVAHDDHMNITEGPVWSFTTTSDPFQCGTPFTDPRDGQVYQTIQIGSWCWMAENMNIGTMIPNTIPQGNNSIFEKYCYNDNPAFCADYGGLYQWDETMQYDTTPGIQGICPPGWHMPTYEEWVDLSFFLGGPSIAGGKMKEAGYSHWEPPNTGATNESGFTGLPDGWSSGSGYYFNIGKSAYFWGGKQSNPDHAWFWKLYYYNASVVWGDQNKLTGYSVRCLRN